MGRVAAVVLAGGESRRFGTDKLAAVVDGLPLLDRAVAALSAEVMAATAASLGKAQEKSPWASAL